VIESSLPPVPRFDAEILERGPALVVEVPFDVPEQFGRVRAPVRVTVNDYTFRTTVMRYGGVDYVGFNKQVRAAAGIGEAGGRITVDVVLDEEPRTVDVPEELSSALAADPAARAAFERLSYTHRKEYARWIEEAKHKETEQRRVQKAVAMLRQGLTHP
jgi:Bacteriocin-protection, YdeI or OmpD-Associated/Domain of unknown function (DUF1905)